MTIINNLKPLARWQPNWVIYYCGLFTSFQINIIVRRYLIFPRAPLCETWSCVADIKKLRRTVTRYRQRKTHLTWSSERPPSHRQSFVGLLDCFLRNRNKVLYTAISSSGYKNIDLKSWYIYSPVVSVTQFGTWDIGPSCDGEFLARHFVVIWKKALVLIY